MANYPHWSQVMAGVAVGSFFGFISRLPGSAISPATPNIRELMWPFNGSWISTTYELMQTNQVGSFFLQRIINGVIVGNLITILQEPATPASPVFFTDSMTEPVTTNNRLQLNWLDTNLAGTDPFVTARSPISFARGDFGY